MFQPCCECNAKLQLPKTVTGYIKESFMSTALFLCGVQVCKVKLYLLSVVFYIITALTVLFFE